jgi:tetratricopeptide (TPR) repeat protein
MPVRSTTPRPRSIIVYDLQRLETRRAMAPPTSPELPKLMRELADLYVELEAAALRDKTLSLAQAAEATRTDPQGATRLQAEVAKTDKMHTASRREAIKYYTQLRDQYPKWCQTPNANDPTKSAGCLDEVLYYLGYEYEQANEVDTARKVYLELLRNWPQSRYVPEVYKAFGELFFIEAQRDPLKWPFAEQSYIEVTKYPPPDNKVWGYAHYKLGYVYWHKGDAPRALSEFKKTIEYSQQYPSQPYADELAVSALQDIIPVFALVADPKRAYDFLRPLVGTDEKTFAAMNQLGELYMKTNHLKEAVDLYSDLSRRDPAQQTCYQAIVSLAAKMSR